jgi:hypothetical protein
MVLKNNKSNSFGFKDNGSVLVINLLNRTNLFTCRNSRLDKKFMEVKEEFQFGQYHISFTGRYLNMTDYLLYVYILKKWYIKNQCELIYSDKIDINFSEIAKLLDKKASYLEHSPKKAYESIYKSLERLMGVLVTIHDTDLKETEFNHLLGDGTKLSQSSETLIATIPKFIRDQFSTRDHSFINLTWFKKIHSMRGRALYRFLITHKKSRDTHSFNFLHKLLNSSNTPMYAHREINDAYEELKALKIIENYKVNKKDRNGKKRTFTEYTYGCITTKQMVELYQETAYLHKKEKQQAIFDDGIYRESEIPKPTAEPSKTGNRIYPDLYDDELPM